MRRARNSEFITENDNLIGVVLGADYVAEHEGGIKRIEEHFQFDNSLMGIERRRLREFCPEHWSFREGSYSASPYTKRKKQSFKAAILVFSTWKYALEKDRPYNKLAQNFEASFYSAYDDKKDRSILEGSWDGNGFAINGSDTLGVKNVRELYKAAKNCDLAVWTTWPKNPFGRGGLVVAIVSRISKEHQEEMLKADLEKEKELLQQISQADSSVGD